MGSETSKKISYDYPSYEIFPTDFAYPCSKDFETNLIKRGVKFEKIYTIPRHYDCENKYSYLDSEDIKMCTLKFPPKWGLLMTCNVIQKKKLSYNEETRGYILDDTGTTVAYVFYHVIGTSYYRRHGEVGNYAPYICEYERNIIECGTEPTEEKKIDSELIYYSKGLITRVDHEFKSIMDNYNKMQRDGKDQYVLDKEYKYIMSYYNYYIKPKSKNAVKKIGYVNCPNRLISTFDNIWLNAKDNKDTKIIIPSAPPKDLISKC